jgi:hypothetical protein
MLMRYDVTQSCNCTRSAARDFDYADHLVGGIGWGFLAPHQRRFLVT